MSLTRDKKRGKNRSFERNTDPVLQKKSRLEHKRVREAHHAVDMGMIDKYYDEEWTEEDMELEDIEAEEFDYSLDELTANIRAHLK